MTIRTTLASLALAAALTGCSFQGALDALVEPERQAEIIRTAQVLCRAPLTLQHQFDPQVFAQSQPLFAQLPGQCPTAASANWQLTTYNFNTSATLRGRSERQEYALVVAGDADGPWSEIQLNFRQIDGTASLIIGWNAARVVPAPPAWPSSTAMTRSAGGQQAASRSRSPRWSPLCSGSGGGGVRRGKVGRTPERSGGCTGQACEVLLARAK